MNAVHWLAENFLHQGDDCTLVTVFKAYETPTRVPLVQQPIPEGKRKERYVERERKVGWGGWARWMGCDGSAGVVDVSLDSFLVFVT